MSQIIEWVAKEQRKDGSLVIEVSYNMAYPPIKFDVFVPARAFDHLRGKGKPPITLEQSKRICEPWIVKEIKERGLHPDQQTIKQPSFGPKPLQSLEHICDNDNVEITPTGINTNDLRPNTTKEDPSN